MLFHHLEFALTFNIPLIVVLLYSVVKTETINDDNTVVLLNIESLLTFNILKIELLFDSIVKANFMLKVM